MKFHIDIDENYEETAIIIQAKKWTKELESIMKTIKEANQNRIVGSDREQSILLEPNDIDYIYSERRKVFAVTQKAKIELKMKLYEAESLLEPHHFTRFSKSVVGNMNQIQRFELSFNGNLCVHFKSGNKEYVSRKYVSALKRNLIMGGDESER